MRSLLLVSFLLSVCSPTIPGDSVTFLAPQEFLQAVEFLFQYSDSYRCGLHGLGGSISGRCVAVRAVGRSRGWVRPKTRPGSTARARPRRVSFFMNGDSIIPPVSPATVFLLAPATCGTESQSPVPSNHSVASSGSSYPRRSPWMTRGSCRLLSSRGLHRRT